MIRRKRQSNSNISWFTILIIVFAIIKQVLLGKLHVLAYYMFRFGGYPRINTFVMIASMFILDRYMSKRRIRVKERRLK